MDKKQERVIRLKILSLKTKLQNTDYQAIKYAEGAMSEAEYKPIKEARAKARELINTLEAQLEDVTR